MVDLRSRARSQVKAETFNFEKLTGSAMPIGVLMSPYGAHVTSVLWVPERIQMLGQLRKSQKEQSISLLYRLCLIGLIYLRLRFLIYFSSN